MGLKPVPDIDLESLPGEARLLIERLAERAQEADRLEQEVRLLREMLRLERLKKYGSKGEKLSEEQVELLEIEPGVHAQEVEKEAEVSSRRQRLSERKHAGRNACRRICRGGRKSSSWKARSDSACAAGSSAAVSATRKRKSSRSNRPVTSCA